MNPMLRLIWFTIPIAVFLITDTSITSPAQAAGIEENLAASISDSMIQDSTPASARPGRNSRASIKEAPLSLAACVRIALDENPLLQAAREGVASARASVGMAKSPYYPTVELDGGYRKWETRAFLPEGLSGIAGSPMIGPTDDWSSGLRASYLLFDSGSRAAQLRVSLSREGMAEEEEAAIRQDIALAVHLGFYSLLSVSEAHLVAQQNLDRANAHLDLTQEHWEAGAVAKADVIRARVEVADAKLQLVRAESAIRLARGRLNKAMGLPVELKTEINPSQENMESPDKINLTEALDLAPDRRPIYKAALHRKAAAKSSIDSAKSSFGPSIKADARYGVRDSEFFPADRDWSVGFNINLPLFQGFKRSYDVSRARHDFAKQEAEIRYLVLQVREEVWSAHLKLEEFYEATQASEAVVQDARESMRMTRERYEAGAATATDLIAAQTTLMRAEYVGVESRWSYFSARSTFARAAGTILDNDIK